MSGENTGSIGKARRRDIFSGMMRPHVPGPGSYFPSSTPQRLGSHERTNSPSQRRSLLEIYSPSEGALPGIPTSHFQLEKNKSRLNKNSKTSNLIKK